MKKDKSLKTPFAEQEKIAILKIFDEIIQDELPVRFEVVYSST